jgi:predicted PurR-regulated permease PerM
MPKVRPSQPTLLSCNWVSPAAIRAISRGLRTDSGVEKQDRQRTLHTSIGIAAGLLLAQFVVAAWSRVQPFAIVVLAGLFVAIAMEPAVSALNRRGVRRGLAAWFILFSTIACLAGMVGAVGAVVLAQGADLLDNLPTLAQEVQDRLLAWGVEVDLVRLVEDEHKVGEMLSTLRSNAMSASSGTVIAISKLLAVAFVAFWVSAEGHIIRAGLAALVHPSRRPRIEQIWDIAVERTSGYLTSKVIIGSIGAAVCAVGFSFAGAEYGIALGIWAGVVSAVIPLVGTYLGIGLPILVTLGASPSRALVVLAIFLSFQQVKNLFIGPRVMRHAVRVHPLVGFSAVVIGAALAGGVGALLSIPIVATAQGIITALQAPGPQAQKPPTDQVQIDDNMERMDTPPTAQPEEPTEG